MSTVQDRDPRIAWFAHRSNNPVLASIGSGAWIPDPGCALNEIEGRRAFDSGIEIPIECLGYVEDRDAVYKTSVIPKRNISESMDVQFSVNLNQIIELNEREQSLLLSVAGTHGPSFKILLILVRAGPRTVLVHGSLISCVALQLA